MIFTMVMQSGGRNSTPRAEASVHRACKIRFTEAVGFTFSLRQMTVKKQLPQNLSIPNRNLKRPLDSSIVLMASAMGF